MVDINKNTSELLKKYIEGVETYEDQKKEIAKKPLLKHKSVKTKHNKHH